MRLRLFSWALLPALALTFVVSACGDDDDDSDTTPTAEATESATTPESPTEEDTPSAVATETATATEDGEDAATSPENTATSEPESPTGESDTGAAAPFDADIPDDWYVFPLEPSYAADSTALEAAVNEAAAEAGMPASDLLLYAGRIIGNVSDGGALLLMDPAAGSVIPFANIGWCIDPESQPVTADDFIAEVVNIGETAEVAGSVSHGGTEYDVVSYSPQLMPEVTLYRTWVQDNDCWVEAFLTVETGTEPPLEAWQAFISSLAVEVPQV